MFEVAIQRFPIRHCSNPTVQRTRIVSLTEDAWRRPVRGFDMQLVQKDECSILLYESFRFSYSFFSCTLTSPHLSISHFTFPQSPEEEA